MTQHSTTFEIERPVPAGAAAKSIRSLATTEPNLRVNWRAPIRARAFAFNVACAFNVT